MLLGFCQMSFIKGTNEFLKNIEKISHENTISLFNQLDWENNIKKGDNEPCSNRYLLCLENYLLCWYSISWSRRSSYTYYPFKWLNWTKIFFLNFIYHNFNNVLFSSKFPSSFKATYILPTHKNKDKSDIENYRPVSILPTLSRKDVCWPNVWKLWSNFF